MPLALLPGEKALISQEVFRWVTYLNLFKKQIGGIIFQQRNCWWSNREMRPTMHLSACVAKRDGSSIMAYIPKPSIVKLRNPHNMKYEAQWFDPQTNEYKKAEYRSDDGLMIFEQKSGGYDIETGQKIGF
jgi:hypothetical protein